MSDFSTLINGIPNIPRPVKNIGSNDQAVDATTKLILNFIKQILVDQANQSQITKGAIEDSLGQVADLITELSDLIKSNDKQLIVDELNNVLRSIDEKVNNPVVNVETNQTEVVNVIKNLRFPDNKIVDVGNLGVLTDELKRLVSRVELLNQTTSEIELITPDSIKVSNLKDIKMDLSKEAMKLLKNLEKLNTSANKPLAVRLSDGKSYYKAVMDSIKSGMKQGFSFSQPELRYSDITSGIKAMTGSAIQLVSSSTSILYMEVSAIQQPCAIGDSSAAVDLATPANCNGVVIYPGSNPFKLKISDASQVWADGPSGAAVSFNYYK